MSWTVTEILLATGGKILRAGKVGHFGEIVTDSHRVKKGSVFVALKGSRFDGHRFVEDAARRGAACAVVHRRPRLSRLENTTVVRVNDTLKALGDLARYRRLLFQPKVLAITGSNGKTTTKEMVAAILERASIGGESLRGKVLKTEGNYNNLIGLPLTLLRLSGREKVAVLELGASAPGEIRELCRIALPDMGLITSVAPAHLTGLGSVAGVAREKGEIFRSVEAQGVAVVNLDDPWVRRLGARFRGSKITFGKGGQVRGEEWRFRGAQGTEFTLCAGRHSQPIRMKLWGAHNLANAVGAAAMAHGLGADLEAIRRGLAAARSLPMRMEIGSWRGIGIINDAYNANPASMAAAIDTLSAIQTHGQKIAILGDMLELGRAAEKSHRSLGRQVARHQIDRLYIMGRQARLVRAGALSAGMEESRVTVGKSHEQIAAMLRRQAGKGDWMLFKGSRGMAMEKALAALKKLGA